MLKPSQAFMEKKFTTDKLEAKMMRPSKISLNVNRFRAKKAVKKK